VEDKPKNLLIWYDQLVAFYRKNVENHLAGALEPFIEEMEVKGLHLRSSSKKMWLKICS
jgi:hypothetical protein